MSQDVEKLSAATGADSAPQEEPRGGITPASVLIGAALFLALAWFLPTWSLTKSYMLGMGTLLPLEALFLTLLLLLFNRFGAKLMMVGGVIAAALFTPHWHAAVYTKSAGAAKMLSPLGEWLYNSCAGVITPAQQTQQSDWTPTFLVAAGALLAFAAGALPGWLVSLALPVLRRKLVWRELLVVFVLIASGTYACYSVQFIVGAVTSPYKDDDAVRDFKRFHRPVPIEQDPDNTAGIPGKLVPYDPTRYDMVRAVTKAGEGEAASHLSADERKAIELFRRNIDAALPEPEAVEELLASAAAADAWLGKEGKASAKAEELAKAIRETRDQCLKPASVPAFASAADALRKKVGEVEEEKAKLEQSAGGKPAPLDARAQRAQVLGKGRAVVFGLMTAAAAEETAALERFRKGIRKSLPEPERVEQLLAESDALTAWLNGTGRGAEIAGRLLGALDQARTSLQQAGDAKATAEALKAFETALDKVQAKKNAIDNAARRKLEPFREDAAKTLSEADKVKQLLAAGDKAGAWLREPDRGPEITGQLLGALDKSRGALLQASDVKTAAGALKTFENAVDQVQSEKTALDKAAGRKPEPVMADAQQSAAHRGDGRALAHRIRDGEKATFLSRWARPLCWWLALLGMLLLGQVFLAVLLRRQWTDHEKLMFPHAEVVRALAEGSDLADHSRRVFASPLFWIGAGLSGLIFMLQGLSHYFPSVPAPNLGSISLSTFISERPWTAMERNISMEPYLLGISYLLTSEVSLSMWVFAVFNQVLRVAASAWGIPRDEAWAIHGEWANSDALYTGAILVFVGWLAWSGRRHVWYLIRRGLGLVPADAAERSEPMGYPTAFWGFWLCLAGIMVWCLLVGLKLWVMAIFFGLYLLLVILISRLVAEAGLLTAASGFWPYYPQFTFAWVFGFGQGAGGMIPYSKGWLGAGGTLIPTTLRAASVWSFIWPSMLHLVPLTPVFLTSFKLTEGEPRRKRLLTWAMIAALFIGVVVFLTVTLDTAFDRGAQGVNFYGHKNTPNWVFANWLMRDLVNKERMWTYDVFRMAMMAVGVVVMGALLIFRSLFYWWPLHPIGMVAVGIDGVWFCFLVGWLLKRAALAYGGGAFSQRMNSFFFGLIIGQFGMAAFWSLLGLCGTGVMPPLIPDMG